MGKQTGCLFLTAGSSGADRGQMFEAKAEAKALRPRPRLTPGHFGLEDLTSLDTPWYTFVSMPEAGLSMLEARSMLQPSG